MTHPSEEAAAADPLSRGHDQPEDSAQDRRCRTGRFRGSGDSRRQPQRVLAGPSHVVPRTGARARLESSDRGVSRELVEELAGEVATTPSERLELLQAAGFITEETAAMLEEPRLTQLSRLLAEPGIRPRDRRLLLQYVELALAHAEALGYDLPDAWPLDE